MKDGGSAFPQLDWERSNTGETVSYTSGGMTLRDWFAGQALTGYLAGNTRPPISTAEDVVLKSWHIADLMLAKREAK
jgi:hypothetical protein